MQVSYDEGVAIHIGPESCAVAREGFGEALTGGRIGQPSSRERVLFWVPTPCTRLPRADFFSRVLKFLAWLIRSGRAAKMPPEKNDCCIGCLGIHE